MSARPSVLLLLLKVIALSACEPVAVQNPPGSSAQNPANPPNASPAAPQNPDITGSQRWQHAWSKAMEGVAMGGSIGGPYGAGGGLIIGLITGLVTADSYYGKINNQIYTEQKKDQQLEAAIEQELARQRDLENQVAGASSTATPAQPTAQSAAAASPANAAQKPATTSAPAPVPPQPRTVAQNQNNKTGETLAALRGPPVSAPAPAPFKNVEVRDINGEGVPDLWIYYNAQKPGEVIHQEESTKG